jgi:hypothetical protein
MARGKSWFFPVSTGELCPPTGLNPAHDCDRPQVTCQALNTSYIKKYSRFYDKGWRPNKEM